ncbi:MAG: type II toxin-antitoxin system VapC family toxin [Acidobacteriota bacterium]
MIVADTDILIDALKGAEPARSRIDLELSSGRLATTVVTSFELLSGARRTTQKSRVEGLLAALVILPLEPNAGEIAAGLRHHLESRGEGIGMADYLIAGICLSRNAMLLTRNRPHFQRIPDLCLAALTGQDYS